MSKPSQLPSSSAITGAVTGASPPSAQPGRAMSPSRSSLDVPRPAYGRFLSPDSSTDSLRPPPPSYAAQWIKSDMDPRSSSTQSLAPSEPDIEGGGQRRRLLILYLHGFYGNDSSFRSFPAHVHAYLKSALAETHVVHSKIYPKYKTYKAIGVARDNFSEWLTPHENDMTDIVLVGHSMGGLLAADIVLMPNTRPYGSHPYKHRILGTVALDAPMLGLHPGIVVAGIASIFRSPASPEPSAADDQLTQSMSATSLASPNSPSTLSPSTSNLTPMTSQSTSSLAPTGPPDPTYNQPFFNDILLKDRPFMKSVMHFANKHRRAGENLIDATTNHLLSHLEFGGVLADYPGMHNRYNRIRALEDVDDVAEQHNNSGGSRPPRARVRFVNYYTMSTGRVKRPKSPKSPKSPISSGSSQHLKPEDQPPTVVSSGANTPRISIEDYSGDERPNLQVLDPQPVSDSESRPGSKDEISPESKGENRPESKGESSPAGPAQIAPIDNEEDDADDAEPAPEPSNDPDLPPIPLLPERPQPPDLEQYTDKNLRKQAEKDAKRAQKTYDQAVKERDKAIKQRAKVLEKREKKAQQEARKAEKEEQKRRLREEWALEQKAEAAARAAAAGTDGAAGAAVAAGAKKEKEKKFCTLPRPTGGARDSTWVPVTMIGFDEVGAHCGLFVPGPHYERLVGDVGERVVGWVHDDLSRRAILSLD